MLNCVILMGRLTHDPELKRTGGGVNVCSFRLAVERRFKGQNAERETDFIQCVAWRETAEFISRHFRKGSALAVQGELQIRRYEDKAGNKREAAEVIVSQANFTGERRQSSSSAAPPPPAPSNPPYQPQQQSMIPGQRGPTYAAAQQQPLSAASQADFDEVAYDDNLPF